MGLLKTPQVKGVLLEEFVLRLLANAGYRILDGNENSAGIKKESSGLYLQGRGHWHQTDALVAYDYTPAFIYPIRLIVEAKAYSSSSSNNGKVGLNIIRNAVGVLKDVNENYFSLSNTDSGDSNTHSDEYKIKRYNYTYAIFSLNGFTENAQKYAIAHQVFLIQYYYNHLFDRIRILFENFNADDLYSNLSLGDIRKTTRRIFARDAHYSGIATLPEEIRDFVESLSIELSNIRGSYFGLLNGEYPIHLISTSEIGDVNDEEEVEVYLPEPGLVKLYLNDIELFFELPHHLANIFNSVWKNRLEVANTKARYINYISLTGRIAGRQRNIILRPNRTWLDSYIEMLRAR